MPFKENGEIIAEPSVSEESQKFVRKGDVVAVAPKYFEHPDIAEVNAIELPVDDAGFLQVSEGRIIIRFGSLNLHVQGNPGDRSRRETTKVVQSLTSKKVFSK